MILLHEILESDAEYVAKKIGEAFSIPVELQKKDLTKYFKPLPKFNGYWHSPNKIATKIKNHTPNIAVMVLTHRDLYYGTTSAEDEWIFGYCMGDIQVLSNARMKGVDSRPLPESTVPQDNDKYLKRFMHMAVHELGHDLINDAHMKKAFWVNAASGIKYPLGKHCTDNNCVMYEVVDVLTPPNSMGYLLIGKEKKYDAGLDEHMHRTYSSWFCDDCKNSIVIPKSYTSW